MVAREQIEEAADRHGLAVTEDLCCDGYEPEFRIGQWRLSLHGPGHWRAAHVDDPCYTRFDSLDEALAHIRRKILDEISKLRAGLKLPAAMEVKTESTMGTFPDPCPSGPGATPRPPRRPSAFDEVRCAIHDHIKDPVDAQNAESDAYRALLNPPEVRIQMLHAVLESWGIPWGEK